MFGSRKNRNFLYRKSFYANFFSESTQISLERQVNFSE